MSKKIIAAILLSCFLMAAKGCYYNSEITINQLKQNKKDEIKLFTKNSKEYSLRYLDETKKNNWVMADSAIYLITKKAVPYSSNYLMEKVDTTVIAFSSVKKLYKHTINGAETTFVIAVGLVLLLLTYMYTSFKF